MRMTGLALVCAIHDNERAYGEVRPVALRSVRRVKEYMSYPRSNAGKTALIEGYYILLQYTERKNRHDDADRLHVML